MPTCYQPWCQNHGKASKESQLWGHRLPIPTLVVLQKALYPQGDFASISVLKLSTIHENNLLPYHEQLIKLLNMKIQSLLCTVHSIIYTKLLYNVRLGKFSTQHNAYEVLLFEHDKMTLVINQMIRDFRFIIKLYIGHSLLE